MFSEGRAAVLWDMQSRRRHNVRSIFSWLQSDDTRSAALVRRIRIVVDGFIRRRSLIFRAIPSK